jgi:hypothetical protein
MKVSQSNIHCMPIFLRGTGFGNRLFSWARCQVYAKNHNYKTVAPIWFFPRIRPFLKGGVSVANYLNQICMFRNLKRHTDDYGLLTNLKLKYFGTPLQEPEDLTKPLDHTDKKNSFIPFSRAGGDFHRFTALNGYQEFLKNKLRESVHPKWEKLFSKWDNIAEDSIGINIRRGKDFKDPKTSNDWFTTGLLRTPPLDWFINVLNKLRQANGKNIPAIIVSDGTPKDLEPILKLENVHFLRPGCAVTDLLLLSKTKFLIGSGGSSFSGWANFLGEMPMVTHPGSHMSWYGLPVKDTLFVDVYDPNNDADKLLDKLKIKI